MNEDVESFRYTVHQLIAVDSPIRIENTNAEHAKAVFMEMFASVKQEAYVFCGSLCPEFWGDPELVSAVREAAKREGVMQITFMVQSREPTDDDMLKKMVAKERLESTVKFVHKDSYASVDHHFAVFDGKRYRFEIDSEGRKAFACANNPELAGLLTQVAKKLIAA